MAEQATDTALMTGALDPAVPEAPRYSVKCASKSLFSSGQSELRFSYSDEISEECRDEQDRGSPPWEASVSAVIRRHRPDHPDRGQEDTRSASQGGTEILP